jgi:DNA invertase Pin-like site-specific DNA recombinase
MNRTKSRPAAKPTRAVGIARISVNRPNETSTTTQTERIQAWADSQALELIDTIQVQGRSAYKVEALKRADVVKALGMIQTGAAQVLVTWRIDRVARNARDLLNLIHEVEAAGGSFASVCEQFDTRTPVGKLVVTVIGAIAEMESSIKRERVLSWQEHRRDTGQTPTGPRPFGYQRGGDDNPNVLTIDTAEAAIIRECADRVLRHESLNSIVADLKQRGVKGKNGTPLTHRALRAILLGPTIAACREVDGVFVPSTEWKPILTRRKWDKLRTYLTDPARRTTPTNRRRWLLSGIATCGRCVGDDEQPIRMSTKSHQTGPRYFCPSCHLSVEAERADDLVQQDLLSLLDPKAWRRLRQGRAIPNGTAANGFEQAIDVLTARFKAGDIDSVEWMRLADELQRQQEVVASPPPQLPDVPDLGKAWPKLTIERRRLVLIAATESLTIKPWEPGRVPGFDERRIKWVPVG